MPAPSYSKKRPATDAPYSNNKSKFSKTSAGGKPTPNYANKTGGSQYDKYNKFSNEKPKADNDKYSREGNDKFNKSGSSKGSFKGKSAGNKGGKGWDQEEEFKKRKRPITQGGGEEDEPNSEEEEGMDVDPTGYEEVPAEGGVNAEKKPRMSKEERAALHAAQPHRTALLPSHPLLHDTLLPLWEVARRADLGKEERKVAVRELWDAVKGRVAEVSRGHKGGRVLQTIVKHGGKEERNALAMELQPQWREMMESKYSKFLMTKLIRYCPNIRPLLIPVLSPHLSSLISHAHAVGPLSDFFDLWASAKERRLLVRGFYPKEVAIFGDAKGEKGLAEVLEGMGPEGKGRERVLEGVEKTVIDIFNNTQKQALGQGIFHRLTLEYLTCVYRFSSAEEADKKMHELLTASLESLPEIVHTKDGSAVVRELIVRGNAKDRKQILQSLKKHIEAMCKDGDAQMVLFTAFDCVDDTKLMAKAYITDIIGFAAEFALDKNARRVLLYILNPTSTRHNIPSTLSSLAASAQAARDAGTSKKDPATRRKELLAAAGPGFLGVVAEKGAELVRDPGAGLVVQEIMLTAEGDKNAAIASIVEPLRTPYTGSSLPVDEETEAEEAAEPAPSDTHILDLPHATRTYKLLLSGGHYNNTTKTLHITDSTLPPTFASACWDAMTSEEAGGVENVRRLAKGDAMFVMVEMIEGLVKAGRGGEVKDVLGGEDVLGEIEGSGKKGAGLLVEKIRAL